MPSKKGKLPSLNRPKRPIDLLFGSGARVDVLWCLMKNPNLGIEQSEIMHATGRSIKDVQRALKILEDLELVVTYRNPVTIQVSSDNILRISHQRRRYRIATNNPWIPPLKMLMEMALGGIDLITDALAKFPDISVAFIFGSIATSEQNEHSDIDLMLIGDFDEDEMLTIITGLEKKIGREIQIISYKPDEWYNALQERKHFIVSLMESPKIFLKGSEADLDRIAFGRDA